MQEEVNNTNKNYYVSNKFGNNIIINTTNDDVNIVKNRRKRNLNVEIQNNNSKKGNNKRRRVVKKLIRKKPVLLNDELTHKQNNTTQTKGLKKRRRKVKIKKKKRLLVPKEEIQQSTNYLNGLEEHGQQATKPRRKIVITRKRILPNKSKLLNIPSVEISPTAELLNTQMVMQNTYLDVQIDKNINNIQINESRPGKDILPYEKHNDNNEQGTIDDIEEYDEDDENEDEETEEEDEFENEEFDNEDVEDNEEDVSDDEHTNEYSENEENIENSEHVDEKNNDNSRVNDNEESTPSFQSLPEYEPFFPEFSQSIHAPILPFKTTVLSTVEYLTKTVNATILRTYTFVVTRVAGDQETVTSTTEVRPQIKTTTVTESATSFTTLTLLDLDNMDKVTDVQPTSLPNLEYNPSSLSVSNSEELNANPKEEARNLATRVMSNGVEVIVAGDKTTYPGDKEFKRVQSGIQKPVTLKPSTLSDHMMLTLPQETYITEKPMNELDPNQFVVKTCLTTFTYLTTYLEKGTTTVSSHEQVISNVATEERMNTGKILPTPAVGITLTQYPNLSVGVFHTTYTYLNTILDGEQPLVISSQHVVSNTVTAPDDYLSLLRPSQTTKPVKDTNTYFSTINLEKTLYEDGKESVISTKEVVTQVVITESIPPRDRPVMTSYIALDSMKHLENRLVEPTKTNEETTDVTKTYFVTYTYYNTVLENGTPTIYTNISTESDVVTEKVPLLTKKPTNTKVTDEKDDKSSQSILQTDAKFNILATKVYYTTFTYLTTLLKEKDPKSTIINSSTKIEENIVTETLNPSLFNSDYISSLANDINKSSDTIKRVGTLLDGQVIDITLVPNPHYIEIKPTQVLPIEKTSLPSLEASIETTTNAVLEGTFSNSKPNIITGSTIVFIDDDPFANLLPTPSLSSTSTWSTGASSSSQIVKETKVDVVTSKVKRPGHKTKNKNKVNPSKATAANIQFSSVNKNTNKKTDKNDKNKKQTPGKTPGTKQPATPPQDLLGLGSINIPNTLEALTPVLSAMAGYINQNLKSTRRNDVNTTITQGKNPLGPQVIEALPQNQQEIKHPGQDGPNRSPVYIPVGGAVGDDFEIAESQNIATFEWNDSVRPETLSKLKHEAPLLNDGIPISPGDIITANSDVIVGKPGRVGPRLPSTIPIHNEENNIPLGMKPPPLPQKNSWNSQNNLLKHRPQGSLIKDNIASQANIVHVPNKETPPFQKQSLEKFKGDKRKHIPLDSFNRGQILSHQSNNYQSGNRYKQNQQAFSESQRVQDFFISGGKNTRNNFAGGSHAVYAAQYSGETPPPYLANQNAASYVPPEKIPTPSLQETIYKNYHIDTQNQNSYPPIYAAQQKPVIISSIPLVLPEVIERSTGQPLLVQLQPSQVAFVNIPFNRTTALIYGGSTEIHHNGQYFDDPSPYPEPEFSGIENFKNGVPQLASIYHNTPPFDGISQKQVSGVIKVGASNDHIVKQEPDTSENQKVHVNIIPTKPKEVLLHHVGNANIDVQPPPLSFGLTKQHGDLNAHIINHGTATVPVPSVPIVIRNKTNINYNQEYLDPNYFPEQKPQEKPNLFNAENNFENVALTGEQLPPAIKPNAHPVNNVQVHPPSTYYPKIQSFPKEPSTDMVPPVYHKTKPILQQKPNRPNKVKYSQPPKRILPRPRPRPNTQISEFITPPANKHLLPNKQFDNRYVPGKSPLPIPLGPVTTAVFNNNIGSANNFNPPSVQNYSPQQSNKQHEGNPVNLNKYHTENIYKEIMENENGDVDSSDDHLEDDSPNEYGEVVQESNPRPLKPGEIPIELLRKKESSSTTEKSNDFVRFPDSKQNNSIVRFPYDHNRFSQFDLSNTNIKQTENSYENPKIQFDVPKIHEHKPIQPPEEASYYNIINRPFNTKIPQYVTSTTATIPFGEFENNQQTEENSLVINNIPTISRVESTTKTTPVKQKIQTSSQKPVLIFIDENGSTKDGFFNRRPTESSRPKVTSLPIDTHTPNSPIVVTVPIFSNDKPYSQTERPFDSSKYSGNQPTNEVNIMTPAEDSIEIKLSTTERTIVSNITIPTVDKLSEMPIAGLNSGETLAIDLANLTQEINNMEILQPPPPIEDILLNIPSPVMKPPRINVNSPGHDIVRVPNIHQYNPDVDVGVSTLKPLVPAPVEEMLPPPPGQIPVRSEISIPTTEVVLGMSPPPLITTRKPINNVISVHHGTSIKQPTITTVTTQKYDRPTRPRIPGYRRPGHRRTTTATTPFSSPSTTHRITTYKGHFKRPTGILQPVKIPSGQNKFNKNFTEKNTLPEDNLNAASNGAGNIITPTPTIKSKPSLDVIIGHPNMGDVEKQSVKQKTKHVVEKVTSDLPEKTSTTQPTPELITVPQDLNDIITKPVHHAGNEVKIVDGDSVSKKHQPSQVKESRPTIVPTRYITHTKTHTVTITKTTVVKTLGGPPSTLTILVTKTEKSYIIDTVTEIHTLVKPTSIVETVTTTIQRDHSLYSPEVYQSKYPKIHMRPGLKPINNKPDVVTQISSSFDDKGDNENEDSLEDFIIKDADDIGQQSSHKNQYNDNDSIFVVMTDKNKGGIIKIPPASSEENSSQDQSNDGPPHRDEITENEANNILLGGILIANRPEVNSPDVDVKNKDRCSPECKASRNELCQRIGGTMRCVCRPGFARMFPDRPCNPTYTYSLNVTIDRIGKHRQKYSEKLTMENSTDFINLARKTHEALDRMVMQSDLRDIYHGVHVMAFYPEEGTEEDKVISQFYLQLSDNIDENRMEGIFKKYLRNNNYSLGGTDVFTSGESIEHLKARDFNECDFPRFHDCSDNAQCFNLKGTYTCSCREGFSDLSENMLYPGRMCSAEQVGCELCNYHGTCYSRGPDEILCECFHWYAGEFCQVNLKVLLIGLLTLGLVLFALLLVCIILTCVRRKPTNRGVSSTMGFLPQSSVNRDGTLDRRAMIEDTSSEDSRSETNTLPPYVQQKVPKLKPPPAKGALKKVSKVSMSSGPERRESSSIIFPDQKDRALTVMIPRAKYHPAPPTSPLINYTSFDTGKPSVPCINNEAKLLSYLDAGPNSTKIESKRRSSNTASESFIEENPSSRKTSGALVSAGFEVSATVVNNMGTLGTTCGTEADRSENATLIHKISADLISRADTSSQFNTLRKSIVDDDLESNSNWLDIPRISTVSESRSYDETTIPPPMKSFRSDYDTKSLQHQNDEANTMAERDLGSTFLLPHTHLYKPERGSDISGFESL